VPTDLIAVSNPVLEQIQHPDALEPRSATTLRSIFGQKVVNAIMWLWRRAQEVTGQHFAPIGAALPVTMLSDASTNVITLAAHGFSNADPVKLYTIDGTPPAGLALETVYFVRDVATDTFKLSATSGGSAIDITGPLTGDIWVAKIVAPDIYLPAVTGVPAGSIATQLAYLGSLAALASQVATSSGSRLVGVEEITAAAGGSFGTVTARTLFSWLQLIADKAAKLDVANAFTGNMTIGGTKIVMTAASGDFDVNSNKFHVDGASGNVTSAGSVGCVGVTSSGAVTATGSNNVVSGQDVTAARDVTAVRKVTAAQMYETDAQYANLTDANHSLDPGVHKRRLVCLGLTASRTITLLKATATRAPVNGDWFEITVILADTAHVMSIKREGSADFVGSISNSGAPTGAWGGGNVFGTIKVVYDGTNWRFGGGGGAAHTGADA